MEEQKVHKRRPRYSGNYPKNFHEKYKEHNPDQYKDEVEKIIKKGKTPAGSHIPIMVNEILDFLKIQPGQIGFDATLGYGGHSEKIMERLQGQGHHYGVDVDITEMEKTKKRLKEIGYDEKIFTAYNLNFAEIDKVYQESGPFDYLLADLGVSSMQLDNPQRGFSYKYDGPLDLRMNQTKGISAAERLQEMSQEEIEGMLVANADEPYAKEIAREITKLKANGTEITSTIQLAYIIENALNFLPYSERKEAVKKSCQRTFQALRIDVNCEYEVLEEFLQKLPSVMKAGGRVAILTFHSGEDRIVKKMLKQMHKQGLWSEISKDVMRPSAEECYNNPRARSTKMRYAIK